MNNKIDCIKGFAILWIVWVHTIHPDFISTPIRNPLFFFLSGMFFKQYPFKMFFERRIQAFIVPFFFFYAISYLFQIGVHYWNSGELLSFDFLCLFDFLEWHNKIDYLSINIPLWFLFGLFWIQLIFLCILQVTTKRIYIAIVSLLIGIAGYFLSRSDISLPFMLVGSFRFFIFFALGYLLGQNLLKLVENRKTEIPLGIISLTVFIILIFSNLDVTKYVHSMLLFIPFVPIVFIFFHRTYKLKIFKIFDFYGKNSLIVLGAHSLIHTINKDVWINIFNEKPILFGIIDLILTIITLYFIIIFLNKYTPQFVGKSRN